ncbi:TolC family protein [Schlesneria paludicola]|uniref:TolC family protein n=1 Tax=Schlesneria paludicola TaxID=360056 RepID=UPI00029B2B27|nr:TolC family protein [Schlesneria paludicola]
MRWMRSIRWINALLMCGAIFGCKNSRPVSYLGEADLQYYKDRSLAIEYSNVDQPTSEDVVNSQRPHTVRDRGHDEIWEMPLLQAVHLAVQNNKMIRTRGGNLTLLQTPQNAPSIYDAALRDTGFLFGSRGVEAALADFDASFTSQLVFGKNAVVANSLNPFAATGAGFVNNTDTGALTSTLQKTMANGGTISLNHNVNYVGTNAPSQLFPSSYNGIAQVQYVQPLWAGSGVEYNRIAGPARAGLGAVTGVSQGVAIARINTDISLADFENAVMTMVKDTEDLYWELYLAYRQFDTDNANRDSLLRTWQEVKAKMDVGATGGNASNEAQARDAYLEARANLENSWAGILAAENALRKQLGMPVNDGKLIRPSDNPLDGEYVAQWESTLIDALTRRLELRKQKWQIKSLELQRIAAENVTNPQLNFIGGYQVNGFGNNLLSNTNVDGTTAAGYNSFYGAMARADQTGWNLGLQFSMPLGFRAAHAQLRNIELQLVKARAALSAQELDISHEIAETMQRIDISYMTARTYLDRKVATERRVQATQAEYEAGVRDATLDLVLRAQASNAAAEIAYYTSLVNYNKAITELHMRRGTILENDGINLTEGEWNAVAQQEAVRRAWARSFATPNNWLKTEPAEFASPVPYPKTDIYPGVPDSDGILPTAAPVDGMQPSDQQVEPGAETTSY